MSRTRSYCQTMPEHGGRRWTAHALLQVQPRGSLRAWLQDWRGVTANDDSGGRGRGVKRKMLLRCHNNNNDDDDPLSLHISSFFAWDFSRVELWLFLLASPAIPRFVLFFYPGLSLRRYAKSGFNQSINFQRFFCNSPLPFTTLLTHALLHFAHISSAKYFHAKG